MKRSAPKRLKGIGASPGIAQGRVFVLNNEVEAPPQFHIKSNEIEFELKRFDAAVAASAKQIRDIRDRVSGADGGEHVLILEAHLLMLSDALLLEGVRKLVRDERLNAEWGLRRTVERIRQMFDGLAQDYFRERGSDVDFVGERIMRNLMGQVQDLRDGDLPEDAIVVAHDLSPANTAQLARFKVRAMIIEGGSRTLARCYCGPLIGYPCRGGRVARAATLRHGRQSGGGWFLRRDHLGAHEDAIVERQGRRDSTATA
jgi:phosphotransferase system enzyme I (PtsI)